WSVRTGFAPFEYLRKHLRGKRLTLSSQYDHLTWAFERIARLQVTLSDQPLELDGTIFRHRRRQATASMYLTIGKKRVELYVFLGKPADDDYVMVQYAGESALMLMPARLYRHLQPPPG
ncbi:MAG TPA: hypothetical protein VL172_01865, partial [Kofleriaceae bacterium]|nr:hypothetical protein [Kofleriaceae bacterium]